MPEGFDHPEPYWDDETRAYWLPLVGSRFTNRASRFLRAIGRLEEGATREDAQAELTAIAARLRAEYPQDAAPGVWLKSLREEFAGAARRPLMLLRAPARIRAAHRLRERGASAADGGRSNAMESSGSVSRWALRDGALLRLQLIEGMILALGGARRGDRGRHTSSGVPLGARPGHHARFPGRGGRPHRAALRRGRHALQPVWPRAFCRVSRA